MAVKKTEYNNESITQLKGPDQVRLRPAVIFGSDGLDGCKHSVFEIISNSADEAREGYGKKIIVTKYSDNSVEVQDFGRGAPVDFNNKEQQYNYVLLFETLYAGSKYNTNNGGDYEYSIGLNGLGLASTQFASEFMDVEIKRDGFKRASIKADLLRKNIRARIRERKSDGSPTLTFLPKLIFPLNILLIP